MDKLTKPRNFAALSQRDWSLTVLHIELTPDATDASGWRLAAGGCSAQRTLAHRSAEKALAPVRACPAAEAGPGQMSLHGLRKAQNMAAPFSLNEKTRLAAHKLVAASKRYLAISAIGSTQSDSCCCAARLP